MKRQMPEPKCIVRVVLRQPAEFFERLLIIGNRSVSIAGVQPAIADFAEAERNITEPLQILRIAFGELSDDRQCFIIVADGAVGIALLQLDIADLIEAYGKFP